MRNNAKSSLAEKQHLRVPVVRPDLGWNAQCVPHPRELQMRNSSGCESKVSSATLTKSSRFILHPVKQIRARSVRVAIIYVSILVFAAVLFFFVLLFFFFGLFPQEKVGG